ncbi:Stk1 family PASTA domain-containing Ser/Thr kinase [Salisediminibacterium halotolerans]|uniref:Serine/threonine-protein kinase PrkC n=1 Tax=Salisediminibacterium halotolerans TaxID=517425 RepID=A0A1H9PXX1_9BACI|nr:Stk1 family PASTA domain-containing Ser/Thr kinase [Salisediminibacterium haloalkalitolerans]SER53081.1 serine/threonine protein kinase [Salisediminibacterium haloalkalitolerans]
MIEKRVNDRYEIIRSIGAGGMADVYLARDLILDRDVAVKVLKEQFSNDDEFIRRFRREAKSATSLSHPNVVSIFDVGEEDDEYFIVMEYVDGMTLKEYIQQYGRLSAVESMRILDQLTSAVGHAHDNQIVHRDLKPQNILIRHDGTAKVTDFGISRAISDATITHTNSVLGSVHYLSPEQAKGGFVTYQSDLYALGVIAYEMLSGDVPFSGDTAVSIAIKHLQEPIPSLKEMDTSIPQSVENIIIRSTAKDAADRYRNAAQMNEDVVTALNPERLHEAALPIVMNDSNMTKAVPIIGGTKNVEDKTIVPGNSQQLSADERQASSLHTNKAHEKPDRKAMWLKLGALGAGAAVVILFLAFYFIPNWLHVDEVTIPDNLIGMHYEEAEEILAEDLQLEVETERRFDDEIEEDHVVSHNPDAGSSVKVGALITLVVSDGMEPVEMDELTGVNRGEAEDQLDEFAEVEVDFEETYESKDDTVMQQEPAPGETVIPAETSVKLTVSETPEYTMDNLRGMTRDEIVSAIGSEPLLDFTFEDEPHERIPEGEAFEQDPQRGETINEPTTVEVVFSEGPEEDEENEENANGSENNQNENNEEEVISGTVPFSVSVPDEEENNDNEFDVVISVADDKSDEPEEEITEEVTEDTEYDVPMSLYPGETGRLILEIDGEEFADSPYEFAAEDIEQ